MTEAEQFEEILNTMTSIGWKLIVQDIKELLKAVERIDDIQTVEELYKRKGEAERLRWFINLKEWYQFSEELNREQNV